ncbi:MAG TPA: biotin transporter BioY [Smithellaceae bacterium]|nr:biotin transporter BioY [Smithellaceae bacterium]HPG54431.1 biotin transporter BioY [Smithellaceae bacterium]HPM70900.1 biotin transporter BioY [Smithellaceae bacterium]HPW22543.1 biotin transporter BioY [Smithellaceae bacterium]HQB92598.1 biotin transporter BioY [Smithellaceae bacterium]
MPADRKPIKGIVYAALFGALTAAGAFIIIPVPPVPITAQTFFLNVAASLLGGPLGATSQFIYVMLGVVGVPVFAGGKAGLGVLFGPTGGYLIGFIVAAFVIGILAKMKKDTGVFWYIFSMFIGMVIIDAFGTIQLSLVAALSLKKAFGVGVLPFLPGDITKIVLAAIVSSKLKGRIKI